MKPQDFRISSGLLKRTVSVTATCVVVLIMFWATSTAFAQTPPSADCAEETGIFTLVPTQGPAGSGFSLTGSVSLALGSNEAGNDLPSVISGGPFFEVWWVETDMAGASFLGTMPSTYDNVTLMASFSGSFMIPETSLPGQHQVAIKILDSQMIPACEDFSVTHTVQADAYTQTAAALPVSLPSTGFVLLAPLAGFMAMGVGG